MKKVLVGLSNNISQNIKKIKVWSQSFKSHTGGDVVLLCANINDNEINLCKELGIIPIPVVVEDTWYINNKRLKHTLDFISSSDYGLFMVTDVFDVAFQNDPFVKMDGKYDVFVGSEGLTINEEPWNGDVISKVFPNDLELCRQHDIICSGVIGGKKDPLVRLYTKLNDMCENSNNSHNIKDQAALIVMIVKNEIENLKIFSFDEGWTLHCAIGGPTQFFESWGFKNTLTNRFGGIPYIKENKLCNHKGEIYDIVHQFNRIPEWNELITKEYE
jgi:thiamine pyrophosphokinase